MPLFNGKSKAAVQKNTQTEIQAGKDPKQAYAIAKSKQREARLKDKGRGRVGR